MLIAGCTNIPNLLYFASNNYEGDGTTTADTGVSNNGESEAFDCIYL